MMAYLTRRENFADGNFADGSPPPKKPYSAVQFKNKADVLLQGVYGTGKSSNAFLVDLMQKELDKAVEEGVVTMQEGLEFIKSRKKYYDDYLKEQSKTTDGLLKTGPNKGKYVLRSKIDGERARRFFDTKEEFDEAVKISQAKKGGGARDMSKRISKPTNSEIEISEKVYGDKYNKKGTELWKSLTVGERGNNHWRKKRSYRRSCS
jgi:hypothetical protein